MVCLTWTSFICAVSFFIPVITQLLQMIVMKWKDGEKSLAATVFLPHALCCFDMSVTQSYTLTTKPSVLCAAVSIRLLRASPAQLFSLDSKDHLSLSAGCVQCEQKWIKALTVTWGFDLFVYTRYPFSSLCLLTVSDSLSSCVLLFVLLQVWAAFFFLKILFCFPIMLEFQSYCQDEKSIKKRRVKKMKHRNRVEGEVLKLKVTI